MGRGGRTVGSSGTVFFQDNDHSPCLWCVACLDRSVGASCTRRAFLLCRVRKCIERRSWQGGSALLFRVGPMPALECLLFGVFFVFPSFYCLRAALACVTQFGVPSWQAATLPAPFGTYINRGHLCICVLLNTGCRQDAVGTNSAGTTHAREQHRTGNRGSQPQPIKTAMDW